MRTSIHTRLIVATNLVVLAVSVAVGWIGVRAVGRVIEDRLVHKAASDAAGLVAQLRLPLSDTLMNHLRQILGSDVAAGPAGGGGIVSSSLPEGARAEFARALPSGAGGANEVVVRGVRYFVGMADVPAAVGSPPDQPGMRLYLLAPHKQIQDAKRRAAMPIVIATIFAIIAATSLSSWLSASISRPVRDLAAHMNRLSNEIESIGHHELAKLDARPAALPEHGPVEFVQLVDSFNRLLQHLQAARLQLAQTERFSALGELAASIAHECRNPLSGIKMNARVLADELARAGKPDDPSVDLIIREIDRLDLYFQELLNFAAGSRPLAAEAERSKDVHASIPEAADSVLRLLEGRCRHAGVEVKRCFPDSVPDVQADPGELRQVLLNLCINALDAMPEGGTLVLGLEESETGLLACSVSDTGAGIDVPGDSDIFSAFVTTKQHGAGLGLHICRKIVERQGGSIDFTSSPEGTTFRFRLRIHEQDTDTADH